MSSNGLMVLSNKLAERFGMGANADVLSVLKSTAFKGQASDAQLTALLIVAQQYDLNPFTKELYAFPDKNNGIVPVVGVDGWSRIINNHPQFDGMDFQQDAESCTCIIHRKDRSHPVKVTEYMAECRRANVGPWMSHPRRMLRHKAMIQCARLAFGYGGIYDQDEAERIAEVKTVDPATGEILTAPTFDLDAALAAVKAADNAEALAAVWTKHVALCQAAKDKTGYDALKSAVVKRGEALKSPAVDVQDVEPRMDAEQMEHEDASR
jgi:phage recombination protein Bet